MSEHNAMIRHDAMIMMVVMLALGAKLGNGISGLAS